MVRRSFGRWVVGHTSAARSIGSGTVLSLLATVARYIANWLSYRNLSFLQVDSVYSVLRGTNGSPDSAALLDRPYSWYRIPSLVAPWIRNGVNSNGFFPFLAVIRPLLSFDTTPSIRICKQRLVDMNQYTPFALLFQFELRPLRYT